MPALVTEILKAVFAGGRIPGHFRKVVGEVAEAPLGKQAAESFGRNLTKCLDTIVAASDSGVPIEQRVQTAQAMAEEFALQMHAVEEMIRAYVPHQEAVVRALEAGDTETADRARKSRKVAQDRLRQALVNLGTGKRTPAE